MSAIAAPVITKPDRPTRKYWTDGTRSVQTNSKSIEVEKIITELEPVKEDWEHHLDIDNFKLERRSFQEQIAAWKETILR